MSSAGFAFALAEELGPAGVGFLLDEGVGVWGGGVGAQDGDVLGVVAVEVGGVDFYPHGDAGGGGQADRDAVWGVGVVAPGFPAIVPVFEGGWSVDAHMVVS